MGEREYRENQPERSRSSGRENSSSGYYDGRNPDISYVNTELTEEELEEYDVIAFAALNPERETTELSPEPVASNYLDAGWGELGNQDSLTNSTSSQLLSQTTTSQTATQQNGEEVAQFSPEDNQPGIVVTNGLNIAVPGTTTTYVVDIGDHLEPSDGFSYQWTVINDPAAVVRERANGNPNPLAPEVSFRETSSARFEAPWAFEGNHTVVVRVFYGGRLRDTYSYEQEVIDAESNAIEALNEKTAPGLQPDVYIAQLQLAKQIAESQGAEERQLRQIDEAIANAESHLGITEDNPTGEAEPITATLIPTAQPNPVPLQLYLKPEDNGVWAIVDLTDPGNARTYRGRGNRSAESTTTSAITHAWENFIARNPHPSGQIAAKINHSQTGANVPLIRNDHSDGISELGKIGQWFSRVGLVAGIGAIALTVAPVPGSRVAAGLLIVSAGSGVAAGGLNIADRLQHGNFEWDGETALDLVDIAAGLAVGVGTAVQLGGKAASIARLRNTVLISEGIETGSDVASGVILSALHYRRIEEIRASNLPEEQKQAQIQQELSVAAANGGLILLGTVGLRRGNKGDYLDVNSSGFGTTSSGTGRLRVSADEMNQLRAIGLDNAEFQRLQDPNLPAAERQALIARHQTAFADLTANFDEGTIQTFVQRLGGKGFRQVMSATGNEGLENVLAVLELERQGRITGFEDWVSFLNKGNRDDTNITNLVAELSETKRLSTEISDGEVINIGGDAQVVPRRDGSIPPSYDISFENQAGEVTRNIDVTTVNELVTRPVNLKTGIVHAVEKADAAGSGTIESTIRIDLPQSGHTITLPNGSTQYFGESGRYTIVEPTGTSRRTGANTFEGERDLIEDIRVYLGSNKIPDSNLLNGLNLVDKSGGTLATYKKVNGSWTIIERGI